MRLARLGFLAIRAPPVNWPRRWIWFCALLAAAGGLALWRFGPPGVPAPVETVRAYNPEDDYDPDLLPPVRGTVVDPRGNPVPDARVVLRLRDKGHGGVSVERSADDDLAECRTNRTGEFEFRGISPPLGKMWSMHRSTWRMSLDVVASAPGHGLGWLHLEEPGTVEVELSEEASIQGRVLDTNGRPVADADVQLLFLMAARHLAGTNVAHGNLPRPDDPKFVSVANSKIAPAATKTDADGCFAIAGIPAGYGAVLNVRHPDHNGDLLDATTSPGLLDKQLIKRHLQPGDRLVTRLSKKLFVAVRGVYEDTGETAVETRRVISLDDWRPRSIKIAVPAPPGSDYLDGEETVALSGELLDREVVVKLPRGVSISGHVVDDAGRGIPGAVVQLALTRPVAPLKAPQLPEEQSKPVPAPPPVRPARPRQRSGVAQQPTDIWSKTVTTDADGSFRRSVPLGSVAVSVIQAPESYRVDPHDVRLLIAGRTQPIDDLKLPLKSHPRLRGVALDPTGGPVPRAEIVGFTRFDNQTILPFHASTDSEGRFDLLARVPIRYAADGTPRDDLIFPMAFIIRHDFRRLAAVVEAAADVPRDRPLVVRLSAMRSVSGRVIDATTGEPLEWATLWLRRQTNSSPGTYEVDTAPLFTKPDGRFSFDVISGEKHSLSIGADGYYSGSRAELVLPFTSDEDLDFGDLQLEPMLESRSRRRRN